LADRIRDDLTGCVAERTAIALQIARALHTLHRSGKYHGHISSNCVYLDEDNRATFEGEFSGDSSCLTDDIRGFGLVLYELFAGKVLDDERAADTPDVEPLHKAGITPHLVEIVRRCLVTPDLQGDLASCVKELEELLRQMLGEPAAMGAVNKTIVVAAIGVSAVVGVLWILVR